jgi:hypothetical protein
MIFATGFLTVLQVNKQPGTYRQKNPRWTERLSPSVRWVAKSGMRATGVFLLMPLGRDSSADHQRKETTMSPLRARMIEDMTLAGLAPGTQTVYIQTVRRLAAHYRRSPDQLSEEEVRAYLLSLRQNGAARGTFKVSQYGLRFLYCHTLERVWGLFGEKKDYSPPSEAAA